MRKLSWGCVGLLCLVELASADPVMPTREQGIIMRREQMLQQALSEGDLTQIDSILGRNFDLRIALHPARPTGKDAWLNTVDVNQYPGKSAEWTVFSDGVTAWASYLWTPKNGSSPIWVMDRWDGIDENAHLLTRFLAPAKDVK